MTNIEKAQELYHAIGITETLLSGLCAMADWKDDQFRQKVVHALGCDMCRALKCDGCVYYDIKKQLTI